MTKDKLLYALAVHLIGLLAMNEFLDLSCIDDETGIEIDEAIVLLAKELKQQLPAIIERWQDITENEAERNAQ